MRRWRRAAWVVGVVLGMGAPTAGRAVAETTLTAIYPSIGGDDSRNAYPLAVLRLALERWSAAGPDRHFRLAQDDALRTQARVVADLAAGRDLTVAWMGTSAELEARLRPVRVPIWRGLLGYRLLLIARDRQPEFAAVRSLADLARFTMGQGIGWADVAILERAGLTVVTAPYESLFAMTAAGRVDAFPRGAGEALTELAEYGPANPGLAVEQELLLVYRFDMFFFTAPRDVALAEAIQGGLEAAYRDGSFLELFRTHPSIVALFRAGRIEARRRLDIPNPLLTGDTAALPARYWYGPEG